MADVKDNPIINYVAAAAQSHASDTQAKLDIQKQLDVQESGNTEAMLAATRAGGSKATQIAAEESFKASSDAQMAAMGQALGTDWTNQGSKSNYWAREMASNSDKAYAALDVIKDKQTKTLFNDPLGFIEAQFSVPADIATHNYYARKSNVAESSLNEIISASNSAAIATKQMEKRTSVELATAKAEETLALAAGNVAALKQQSAGDKIKGITEINNLTKQQADTVFRVHAQQNSDASLALQRQSQADSHKMATIRLEQRAEELATKASTDADWRAQFEARNMGAKAKGMPPLDNIAAFKREFAVQIKNPVYQDMITYGADIQMNGGALSGVPVAQNAGSAARNYASIGGVNLTDNPVGSYLSQVYSTQKTSPTALKDPIAFAETVNKIAVEGATKLRASIDNSNPNIPNLYAAPPVSVMLKSAALIANPFIVDTVVPLMEINKNVQLADATMLAKAAEFSTQNKANLNIAAEGIVQYYTRAATVNNSTKLFKEHGLPAQVDYRAKIDEQDIDLTDITQVKRYIFQRNMAIYSSDVFGAR